MGGWGLVGWYRVFLGLAVAAEFVSERPGAHAEADHEDADRGDRYQGDGYILGRRCFGRCDFRAQRRPLDLVLLRGLLLGLLRGTGGGRGPAGATLRLVRLLGLQLGRFRHGHRFRRQRRPGVVGKAGQAQQRRPYSPSGPVLTRKRAPAGEKSGHS